MTENPKGGKRNVCQKEPNFRAVNAQKENRCEKEQPRIIQKGIRHRPDFHQPKAMAYRRGSGTDLISISLGRLRTEGDQTRT